jgi:hypothetical protein
MESITSPLGDLLLTLPTVEGDSGAVRPVTILDRDGRVVFQDMEWCFSPCDEVYLAWDPEGRAWSYMSGNAILYLPGDGTWFVELYGEPQRVYPDLPLPPPWLFPGYPDMHVIPDGAISAVDGFTVSESGFGWEFSFKYPPLGPGLEFLFAKVADEMRACEGNFALCAERERAEYGDVEYWQDWAYEGGLSILPAPEGMLLARKDFWTYTGGVHGMSDVELYRYAASTAPDESRSWMEIDTRGLLADSAELVVLSAIVVDSLSEMLGQGADQEWILQGAGPEWGNYNLLTPVPDSSGALGGFMVEFPQYAVADYASGPLGVFVPIHLLRP